MLTQQGVRRHRTALVQRGPKKTLREEGKDRDLARHIRASGPCVWRRRVRWIRQRGQELLHVALSMFKTVRVWVTRLVEAYATTKTLLDAEEGEVDAEVKTGELVLEIVVVAVLLVALVIIVLLI